MSAKTKPGASQQPHVRPLSKAAFHALKAVGADWQKVPHWIKASHVAVLIRQGHIEHRWPFDLTIRVRAGGSWPWLREGEIRLKPNADALRAPKGDDHAS